MTEQTSSNVIMDLVILSSVCMHPQNGSDRVFIIAFNLINGDNECSMLFRVMQQLLK